MTSEPSKTRFVAVACGLYAAVLIASWGASVVWPGPAGYFWKGDASWIRVIGLGVSTGVAVAGGSALFATMSGTGRRLIRLLAEALEGLPWWGAIPLAIAAGTAEEALFRGTLWSLAGSASNEWSALALTSILFGAAHGLFRGRFLSWSIFALVVGILLGGLRMVSGGILAPVIAHVVVDLVNIPVVIHLARREGR